MVWSSWVAPNRQPLSERTEFRTSSSNDGYLVLRWCGWLYKLAQWFSTLEIFVMNPFLSWVTIRCKKSFPTLPLKQQFICAKTSFNFTLFQSVWRTIFLLLNHTPVEFKRYEMSLVFNIDLRPKMPPILVWFFFLLLIRVLLFV